MPTEIVELNSFGHLFKFTTFGESHGVAIGCIIDGSPPNIPLLVGDIQYWLDKRKPGNSKYTSQRKETDEDEKIHMARRPKQTATAKIAKELDSSDSEEEPTRRAVELSDQIGSRGRHGLPYDQHRNAQKVREGRRMHEG